MKFSKLAPVFPSNTSALNDKIDEVNTSIPQSRLIVEEVRECYYKTREKDITKIPQGDVYRNIDTVDAWTWYNVQIEDGYYIYARTKKKYYDGHSDFSDIYVHSKTIINGGFIRTGIIETDKIKIGTNNLDSTIIENGKIKTGLINVDEITAGTVTTDYLEAGNAKFKGSVEASNFGLIFNPGDEKMCSIETSNTTMIILPTTYFESCGIGTLKIRLIIQRRLALAGVYTLYKNDIIVKQYSLGQVGVEGDYLSEDILLDVIEGDIIKINIQDGDGDRAQGSGSRFYADILVDKINYLTKKLTEMSIKTIE